MKRKKQNRAQLISVWYLFNLTISFLIWRCEKMPPVEKILLMLYYCKLQAKEIILFLNFTAKEIIFSNFIQLKEM